MEEKNVERRQSTTRRPVINTSGPAAQRPEARDSAPQARREKDLSALEKLRRGAGLTETEKSVADYIYANREKMNSLTLNVIAQDTYTSITTVLRLCRKLGYNGYRGFQIAVISDLLSNGSIELEERKKPVFQWTEETEKIARHQSETMESLAKSCARAVSEQPVGRAAEWIAAAEHVYLYGSGDALGMAECFIRELAGQGVRPILAQRNNEVLPLASGASRSDVALVVSFSDAPLHSLRQEITLLRKNGCRVVLISPEEACDVDLSLRIGEAGTTENWSEGFAQRMALDYLLTCTAALVRKEKAFRRRDR